MRPKTGRGQPEAVVLDLPGLLVDPSWLAERLGHPGLRTVDLRDAAAYESGHIPGALHLDLVELGSRVGGCDSMLVPPGEFSRIMAERGISNGDTIVAYDDQWGLAAARLLWASHRYGHTEVAVLNGGWDRWRDEGRAASRGRESVTPGRFEARPREHVCADTSWIAGRIGVDDAVFLDTRTSAEFDKGTCREPFPGTGSTPCLRVPGMFRGTPMSCAPSGVSSGSIRPTKSRSTVVRGCGLLIPILRCGTRVSRACASMTARGRSGR